METTANSLDMILYVFIVDGGVMMYILNKVFEGLVVRARVKGRSDHPGLGSLSVVHYSGPPSDTVHSSK